jgi:serine/threonine protein kinase
VSQLLQASQSLPFSFQRQTSILRKIYDSMLLSSDVGEIGNQIGLTSQEILTWFDVEKLRREIWSMSLTALPLSQIRQASAELPTSVSFSEQIRLLRGNFDQNQWPSKEEYLKLGQETCIDAIDVMLWFDTERDIQLRCLQPIPVYVPGLSMAEPAYEPIRQGNGVSAPLPTPHGPVFDLPGIGEHMSPYAMGLSQTAPDARLPEPTSCLGKRTRGQFPCLFCKKHFKTMAYWRNHQTKVHFSEKIYECWESKMDGSQCLYGPVLRADNLRTHLVKEHGYQRDQELMAKVNDRARIVSKLYHDKCGFISCHIDLPDFKTSIDHIAEHLNKGDTATEWVHVCQSIEHTIPPRSKKRAFHDVMQSNENNDDDNDDDDDGDDDGNDYEGLGDDQHNNGVSYGDQRSHGFSSERNRGNPSSAKRNRAQGSQEGGEVATPPQDCCCNSQSPEVVTPSADGMTSDIAVLSVHGTHPGRNIEALQGPKLLNLDNYFRRIRFLGRGRLGFVEKVASVASNKIYARKTIHRSQLNFEDRVDAETLNEELEILKSLRHSHLVRLIDIYTSGDYFYLFMSPVADGNLASFFHARQNGQLSQDPAKQKYLLLEWMSCLQSAVAYLHSQNVVHEDLMPENILVKENTIFLTNVKDLKQFANQEIIEAREGNSRSMYCAPETVVYGIINDKSNTFSMGCIFLEMLTLHFDKGLLDFQQFRTPEAVDVPYYATLDRINHWIELLTDKLPLHSASIYVMLLMAVNAMLIESSSKRPGIREIELGVKDLLQEVANGKLPEASGGLEVDLAVCKLPPQMAIEKLPEQPSGPEIVPDAGGLVLETITEESSEWPSVPKPNSSIKFNFQGKIVHTGRQFVRPSKWDWDSHLPKMRELYNTGYSIPQIYKAIQSDDFRPRLALTLLRCRRYKANITKSESCVW